MIASRHQSHCGFTMPGSGCQSVALSARVSYSSCDRCAEPCQGAFQGGLRPC
jgi:hypothetical protein